jgi:hypothetical protein
MTILLFVKPTFYRIQVYTRKPYALSKFLCAYAVFRFHKA